MFFENIIWFLGNYHRIRLTPQVSMDLIQRHHLSLIKTSFQPSKSSILLFWYKNINYTIKKAKWSSVHTRLAPKPTPHFQNIFLYILIQYREERSKNAIYKGKWRHCTLLGKYAFHICVLIEGIQEIRRKENS